MGAHGLRGGDERGRWSNRSDGESGSAGGDLRLSVNAVSVDIP